MARKTFGPHRTRTSTQPQTEYGVPIAFRALLLLLGLLGTGSVNSALTACSDTASRVAAVETDVAETETAEEAVTTGLSRSHSSSEAAGIE
jgi:hypothetical protein